MFLENLDEIFIPYNEVFPMVGMLGILESAFLSLEQSRAHPHPFERQRCMVVRSMASGRLNSLVSVSSSVE